MKYPRTYHLPFSPEIHSDDKVHQNPDFFIGKEVIVTEKLDGGNCSINSLGEVFARSVSTTASHGSFSMVKNLHAWKMVGKEGCTIYGENLEGIHSIEYDSLDDCFYSFGMKCNSNWLSFDELTQECKNMGIKVVPRIFRGVFNSLKEIERFMDEEISKPSSYGKDREGFVIRLADGFSHDMFGTCVAKYVRANHVQTDKHWSQNWKRAEIKI